MPPALCALTRREPGAEGDDEINRRRLYTLPAGLARHRGNGESRAFPLPYEIRRTSSSSLATASSCTRAEVCR